MTKSDPKKVLSFSFLELVIVSNNSTNCKEEIFFYLIIFTLLGTRALIFGSWSRSLCPAAAEDTNI